MKCQKTLHSYLCDPTYFLLSGTTSDWQFSLFLSIFLLVIKDFKISYILKRTPSVLILEVVLDSDMISKTQL